MSEPTLQEIIKVINKLQYLLGEQTFKSVIDVSNRFGYNDKTFSTAKELVLLIDYFYNLTNCPPDNEQTILQYIDFIETRYNLNKVPYIEYTKRITNILSGGTLELNLSGFLKTSNHDHIVKVIYIDYNNLSQNGLLTEQIAEYIMNNNIQFTVTDKTSKWNIVIFNAPDVNNGFDYNFDFQLG